jgi:hypothetical protein
MGVNVLSMLTRLRQIALDRRLVPPSYLEVRLSQHHSYIGAYGITAGATSSF